MGKQFIRTLFVVFLTLSFFVGSFVSVEAAIINRDIFVGDILDLPKTGNVSFNFTAPENTTFFYKQDLSSPHITLDFPKNHTFIKQGNFTPFQEFTIIYSVDFFTATQNQTLNLSVLVGRNTTLSDSVINLFFQVYVDPTLDFITTEELAIVTGGYNISISENLLPFSGGLDFIIRGPNNQEANITKMEQFLNISDSKIKFNASGFAKIKVEYLVPSDTQIGRYDRIFEIASGNTTRTGKVTFTINRPPLVFKEYGFDADCFESTNDRLEECLEDSLRFYTQQTAELINQLRKEKEKLCEPEINHTVEYVVIGEVSRDHQQLLTLTQRQLNSTSDDLKELRHKYDVCVDEKNNIQKQSNEEAKQLQNSAFQLKVTKDREVEEKVSNIYVWIFSVIGIIIFILACWWSYKRLSKLLWWD